MVLHGSPCGRVGRRRSFLKKGLPDQIRRPFLLFCSFAAVCYELVMEKSVSAVAMVGFLAASAIADEGARPANWAAPLARAGLPNLHRVDKQLYRGAQPTLQGFEQLRALGIKTVVSLRNLHSDRESIAASGLGYEEIPMTASAPTEEQVVQFLKIATDPKHQPVFVHCQHGADRTGTMVAAYRMAVQSWSAEQAIAEMTRGGFGYHAVWRGLLGFLRRLDVAPVKARALHP